jgi:spermidine synthase
MSEGTPILTYGPDETPREAIPTGIIALWSATIFLSAFLLFQIQPILAKKILPWFGGAAGVWATSLMFFQVTYLLGNYYAHLLVQRFRPAQQMWTHVVLLGASIFLLPVIPRDSWKPIGAGHPAWRILGLLTVTVGLPFLLLSATSPLLQAWYVRRRTGGRPYRFYALSNAGSLLALLSYPVFFEPRFSTRHQAIGWSAGYLAFALLCGAIAYRQREESTAAVPSRPISSAPGWGVQLLWVALAADASAFLLAVTNHLSQNVAAVPLLWILPLSLYLLSLILCFESRTWYRRFFFLRMLAVALGGMAYALSPDFANAGPVLQVPLFCGGLFICCMVCHGELVNLKPESEHLTKFYLMVSLGGALGGIFVSAVAPHIFRGFYELPVAIAGCAILLRIVLDRDPSTVFHGQGLRLPSLVFSALVGLLIVSLAVVTARQSGQARFMARNFYGVVKVNDLAASDHDPPRRELANGTITHGVEIMVAGRHDQPTTYYGPESGAALALQSARQRGPVRAGIIGLGAGTLAAYGRGGDRYTFYEINPLVIEIANTQFDFLRDSQAQITAIAGDARLSLERQPPQNYDVLAVDAFSGDAIPVHLLTREAFELYFRHLNANGVLAIHVSNKYLDLNPVVKAVAESLGRHATTVVNPADAKNEVFTSTWMIVGKTDTALESTSFPTERMIVQKKNAVRPWTDDYSNLIETLK